MELVDRSAKEQSFTLNLARSFSDYRETIDSYLIRGAEIPDPIWSEIETDMQQKLTALLLLLFMDAATLHGGSASAVEASGLSFAQDRAQGVAGQFVANTRDRILTSDPVSRREVVVRSLSSERAASMSATETTVATSAGGEQAVILTVGTSEMDLWYTAADNRVCKICGPLHGAKRSEWSRRFSLGPPGHPGCRCWIEYEFERN